MKSDRKIFMFVKSGLPSEWMVTLLQSVSSHRFKPFLVSLEKNSGVKELCYKRGISYYSLYSRPVLTIGVLLRNFMGSGKSKNLMMSHGFHSTLVPFILRITLGSKYIMWHHHQPFFFENLPTTSKMKVAVLVTLEKLFCNLSYRVISNSSQTSDYLKYLRVDDEKVIKLPLGIDFSLINSRLRAEPSTIFSDSKIEILMVGRLVWEKNYHLALDIINELQKKTKSIRLNIVGTGPEHYPLQQSIDEYSLSDYVRFLGHQNNPLALMRDCDIFLHTALTESYGQVILEAILSPSRVLTTRVGVVRDLEAHDLQNLYVIQDLSPKSIAEEIIRINAEPLKTKQVRNLALRELSYHEKSIVFTRIAKEVDKLG